MKINKIIVAWGILDLSSIGWYILWVVVHGKSPFYPDLVTSINTARSFEHPLPVLLTIISSLLYLTLIPSGYLLYKQKPVASKVVYFQTLFRLAAFMPPSIFFITWPLKLIFEESRGVYAIITLISLILLSEALKTYSVYHWRRGLATA
jgi:hypothetical protein